MLSNLNSLLGPPFYSLVHEGGKHCFNRDRQSIKISAQIVMADVGWLAARHEKFIEMSLGLNWTAYAVGKLLNYYYGL